MERKPGFTLSANSAKELPLLNSKTHRKTLRSTGTGKTGA
jgi:hypothetical protein